MDSGASSGGGVKPARQNIGAWLADTFNRKALQEGAAVFPEYISGSLTCGILRVICA